MSMREDPLNLMISGVGGQGNILLSRMIGNILGSAGYQVTIGETFGAAQRGGAVFSSLRVSPNRLYGPLVPKGGAHVILGLEPLETLRVLSDYGNPGVVTLTNTRPVFPVGVLSRRTQYPDLERLLDAIRDLSRSAWFLDATGMAVEMKTPIVANMIMLGALVETGCTPVTAESVEQEVRSRFPAHQLDLNFKALEMGQQAVHAAHSPQIR